MLHTRKISPLKKYMLLWTYIIYNYILSDISLTLQTAPATWGLTRKRNLEWHMHENHDAGGHGSRFWRARWEEGGCTLMAYRPPSLCLCFCDVHLHLYIYININEN